VSGQRNAAGSAAAAGAGGMAESPRVMRGGSAAIGAASWRAMILWRVASGGAMALGAGGGAAKLGAGGCSGCAAAAGVAAAGVAAAGVAAGAGVCGGGCTAAVVPLLLDNPLPI